MQDAEAEGGRRKAALPSPAVAEATPLKEIAKVLLNLFKNRLTGFLLIFGIAGVFL